MDYYDAELFGQNRSLPSPPSAGKSYVMEREDLDFNSKLARHINQSSCKF